MKTKRENAAFITIEPHEPEYKQILAAAMKHRDKQALEALKGNTHKPIRYVTQWFLWALMTHEHDQSDWVNILSPEVRQNVTKFRHHLKARDAGENDEGYKPGPLPIPEDIYDFLL